VLRILTVALALALTGYGIVATWSESTPTIDFDETVPEDLRSLATATWEEFTEFHQARTDCLRHVTLAAAWELDSRGEYRPDSSLVVVRVPGTVATLRNEMVHEFAHHIEFTCDSHRNLREDFLEAQGFAPTTPWFEGPSWETTPSEHYAEATVEIVLGMRHHHGNIHITEAAADVVRRWARGP